MFSYRHAFHAGNHADVLKHLTLVAMLKYLTDKDSALTVIDTHAGTGLYRLDGDMARTSAEATQGVQKLLLGQVLKQNQPLADKESAQSAIKNIASALQDDLDALTSFNSSAT